MKRAIAALLLVFVALVATSGLAEARWATTRTAVAVGKACWTKKINPGNGKVTYTRCP